MIEEAFAVPKKAGVVVGVFSMKIARGQRAVINPKARKVLRMPRGQARPEVFISPAETRADCSGGAMAKVASAAKVSGAINVTRRLPRVWRQLWQLAPSV